MVRIDYKSALIFLSIICMIVFSTIDIYFDAYIGFFRYTCDYCMILNTWACPHYFQDPDFQKAHIYVGKVSDAHVQASFLSQFAL